MNNHQKETRRRFLLWGACTAVCTTLFSGIFLFRRSAAPPAVKTMLTQYGTLVQVDITKIQASDTIASNKEVQEWIKR